MTVGGIIYLALIWFIIFLIIVAYFIECHAAGIVDSWFRKPPQSPPPSFALGRWTYDMGYGEKKEKREAEERSKNLKEYERLRKAGLLHSQRLDKS